MDGAGRDPVIHDVERALALVDVLQLPTERHPQVDAASRRHATHGCPQAGLVGAIERVDDQRDARTVGDVCHRSGARRSLSIGITRDPRPLDSVPVGGTRSLRTLR
jgi:hypothetical protein